jgi:hypothetical protein
MDTDQAFYLEIGPGADVATYNLKLLAASASP